MLQSDNFIPYIEDTNFISTGFNQCYNKNLSKEDEKNLNSLNSSNKNTYESYINESLHNVKNF